MREVKYALMMTLQLSLITMVTLSAQTKLEKSVISNGGEKISNQVKEIKLTIGQPIVGKVADSKTNASLGFWHPKDESILDVKKVPFKKRLDQQIFSQNYPNPFSESTTFDLTLPNRSYVTMEIYDATGILIDVLLNKELDSGNYIIEWKANDVIPGIYSCRLQVDDYQYNRTLIKVDN